MTAPQLVPTWDPSVQWDPQVEEYLTIALGAERLRAISAATVRPPLSTCLRVNTLRSTPEEILRHLPDAMAPDDRQVLANSCKVPYIHQNLPMAVMVPGSGPHAIDYAATQGRELIVGRKAGEAILRGANVYAPGILAVSSGIAQGDLLAVSVGLELPGTSTFGVTRGTILPPHLPLDDPRFPLRQKLFLGVGRAEVPRSGMNPSAQGLVVSLVNRVFSTPSMGDIFPGEIMLQNLPSLVAAVVLGPTPGSRVLDMCAAPGGKTTAMAQLMGDVGEVVALDRSHSKVVGITKLAEELGIKCIKAYKADATKAVADSTRKRPVMEPESEKSRVRRERIAAMKIKHGVDSAPPALAETTDGFAPESFDYVLLDAPCTALGLRPRLVLPQKLEELHSTALYQRRFLDAAVRLVRPGGYLVFSTCTINPGENEANVRYVLDKYRSSMELVQQTPRLGGRGLTGSVPNGKGGDQKLLSEDEAELVQRFDPSAELDTIGFFIAKFKKIAPIDSSSGGKEGD